MQPKYLAEAQKNWAIIQKHLKEAKIDDELNSRIILANVLHETAHRLIPLHEFGQQPYFRKMYWENLKTRKALGNIVESDAWEYAGRGFIQLTGRHNYEKAGGALNLPLLSQPELMLKSEESARALVWYWRSHGLDVWANKLRYAKSENDKLYILQKIRRLINGGLNGWDAVFKDLKTLGIV